jgi:hypothetical protein
MEARGGFRVLGWAVLTTCLCSCYDRALLKAPNAAAPIEQREAAYERLRPISYHQTHLIYVQGSVPVATEKSTDYLQLADGTRVQYPEDILPVVPKGSPSALAAERSQTKRTTAGTIQGIGFVSAIAGMALVVAPIVSRDTGEDFNTTPLYAGLGMVLAGGILFMVGRSFRSDAADEAATAYETYDAGLREHLGICSSQDPKCRIRPGAQAVERKAFPFDPEKPGAAPPPAKPEEQPEKPVYKPSSGPFGTE